MCKRFFQYLEKTFSCFGQDVNDDNSTAEGSDRDDEDHNSSQSENNCSERESFKSYSENDEESAGEDVVESTGRSGTRDSSYEDCYSKAKSSTSNSISNVESLKSFDGPIRKNTPEKTNCLPKKITSKVGSVKMNQEILGQTSQSDSGNHSKETRQKPDPERRKFSSESATTTLPKSTQSKSSLKTPNVKDNKIFTKKDDKKSVAGKQDHEKRTVREKKSLKIKENKSNHQENKFTCPKSDSKGKENLERERKSTPNEKRKTEEIKKSGTYLQTAVKESRNKSASNNVKMDSVRPHNKSVANKNLVSRMPKNGLKKNNISSRAGTFSKRTKSLPGRSIPKFTSKSIQKRKPIK